MHIKIHDSAKRPWGIETLVTVEEYGEVFNFSISTKTPPTIEELETQATVLVERQKQIVIEKESQTDEIETLEAQKATLIAEIEDLEEQKQTLIAEIQGE